MRILSILSAAGILTLLPPQPSLLATYTQVAKQSRRVKSTPPKAPPEPRCWGAEPETLNPDVKHPPIAVLPSDLAAKPVERRTIILKLCIDEAGQVTDTLVLLSTGDSEVDNFFRRQAAKRRFKPLEKGDRPIKTVAKMSVVWD